MKLVAASAAIGVALFAAPAFAQEIDAPPLSKAELAELRGGFTLPTGIEANFGAIARTFSDGALVLETHFTWTEAGLQTDNVTVSPLLQATDDLVGGFRLEDANGATVFAHQITDSALRNILLNEAQGRDIRVETQLTVTLPSFNTTQENFRNALLAASLVGDMLSVPD